MCQQDQYIAFDVRGTLLELDGTPRYEIVSLLMSFYNLGYTIIIWSGGGKSNAERAAKKIGVLGKDRILTLSKTEAERIQPEIAFDDQFVDFGKANIKV